MRFDRRYAPELLACKDITRSNLAGLQVDVAKKRLCATDGHRLITIPIEVEPGDVDGMVEVEAVAAARKAAQKADVANNYANRRRKALERGEDEPPRTMARIEPKQITPRPYFPPIDQVIPPTAGQKNKITFNPKYLAEIAEAVGAGVVSLSWEGDSDPIRVRNNERPDDDAVVLLMPCRS